VDDLEVSVEFEATAERKALYHKGGQVELDEDGKGTLSVTPNQVEALLAEVRGAEPGSEVKITLTVDAPAQLVMADFEGRVAQNRTVWASSRFFRVKA
jgi:hypothetical protein